MKTFKQLFLFALPALLLTGCNNEEFTGDRGGDNPSGEISFEIGFAPETRVVTDHNFRCTWEPDDEIGLFAVSREKGSMNKNLQTSGNYIHNVKLTYSGGVWKPSEKLFFDGNNVLDFYAYYPYDDNGGSPETLDPTRIGFKVKTDQSNLRNLVPSDLMTAKSDNGGEGYSKDDFINTPIPLRFYHKLSLVEFEVKMYMGSDFGDENLDVKLRKMRPGVLLDLNGIHADASAGGITVPDTADNDSLDINMHLFSIYKNDFGPSTYTYRAYVPAQSIPEGKRLAWLEHEEWLFAISNLYTPKNGSLEAGAVFSYNINVNQMLVYTELIEAAGKSFLMGETGVAEPIHKVSFTKNFRMSKYPVTFDLYDIFCSSTSRPELNDNGWGRMGYPVIGVKHDEAIAFCEWLTTNTGVKCTLPTEAQWEYACRAGTDTRFSYGDTPDNNYMWYAANSGGKTHGIGTNSNPWGLYDMHGNVWEWCSDEYGPYGSGDVSDPTGPPLSAGRYVIRGGSWYSNGGECMSGYRSSQDFNVSSNEIGFRVVFLP